jgi:hypothetical protein
MMPASTPCRGGQTFDAAAQEPDVEAILDTGFTGSLTFGSLLHP